MNTSIPETLPLVDSPFNNATSRQEQLTPRPNSKYEGWFWLIVAIFTLIVAIGIILNSLVIYFASRNTLTGTLFHLNTVVKHLAVADLLYGLLGCPSLLISFKMGKILP